MFAIDEAAPLREYGRKLKILKIRTVEGFIARTTDADATLRVSAFLGISQPGLRALRNTLLEQLPLAANAGARHEVSLGLRPEPGRSGSPPAPPPPLSFPSGARTPTLPDSVDLSPKFTDIRDQEDRSTCVAFASSAAEEFRLGRSQRDHLSPEYFYWKCKKNDGAANAPGTNLTVADRVVNAWGCPNELEWNYDGTIWTPANESHDPPAPAVPRTVFNAATTPVVPTDIVALKRELVKGRPVVVGVWVYDWWMRGGIFDTGEIVLPLDSENPVGGHAICLVGYLDDDPAEHGDGVFFFRNSWGAVFGNVPGVIAWNKPGYGKLPYQYVTGNSSAYAFSV